MSLKARLRGLEAKVEWLERWGELRQVEQALKYREAVAQVVEGLTANPTAAARLGVGDLVRARAGRSENQKLRDAIDSARARLARADAEQSGAIAPEATGPPDLPPPLAPETETRTTDPPEFNYYGYNADF